MDREQKIFTGTIVGIGLVLGLLVGLVVLGWWLWPVQWYNASPANLSPDYQEIYLRNAIDSYTLNPEPEEAYLSYSYLEESGPTTLATVQANPAGQNPDAIAAYATVVAPMTAKTASAGQTNWLQVVCLSLLIVLLLIGAFGLLYLLWRKRSASEVTGPAPVEETNFVVGADTGESAPAIEPTVETPPADQVVQSSDDGVSASGVSAGQSPTEELRDGLSAAGIGLAAAAVMSATASEEEEPAAKEPSRTSEPAKMGYGLEYIEGVGDVYTQKLNDAGISNPQQLLERGATPKGRQEIAEHTGISGKLILRWVNHADLYRIKGVGSEYADLLEAAGVDTVVELATRNPQNLYQTLLEVNETKKLVRKLPVQSQVVDWIEQAKQLPRVLTY